MKQQFRVNTPETFRTYIYENNLRVIPASASITIYRPGLDEKIVDTAPMTIGPDGLLSYALGPAENSQTGLNYKAEIEYTLGGETFYATLFYDVVRSCLVKVVTDDDLYRELPQIRDAGWRVTGTTTGGTVNTITDTELTRYEDEYFTGGLATILDKGETREVTAFVSATGTLTTSAFSSSVLPGQKYSIRRSFTREIGRAFEKIEDALIRMGKRPDLVLDPVDLREAHIYFAVAEVCKGLVTEKGSFWWDIWKDYEARAEDTLKRLRFKYDASGDGLISSSETTPAPRAMRTGRG